MREDRDIIDEKFYNDLKKKYLKVCIYYINIAKHLYMTKISAKNF